MLAKTWLNANISRLTLAHIQNNLPPRFHRPSLSWWSISKMWNDNDQLDWNTAVPHCSVQSSVWCQRKMAAGSHTALSCGGDGTVVTSRPYESSFKSTVFWILCAFLCWFYCIDTATTKASWTRNTCQSQFLHHDNFKITNIEITVNTCLPSTIHSNSHGKKNQHITSVSNKHKSHSLGRVPKNVKILKPPWIKRWKQ